MPHARAILSSATGVPWGLWITCVAAFAGFGAFLDEYYVGSETRTKVRARVSRLLQSIEGSGKRVRELTGSFWSAVLCIALGVLTIWSWHFYRMALHMQLDVFRRHLLLGIIALPFFIFDFVSTMIESCLLVVFDAVSVWILVDLSYNVCKVVLWAVFRPAADPQRSPFKFFTGMVGLWVLAGKLLIELTKTH